MTEHEMIELVQKYFAAVDGEEFDTIAATLSVDCRFSVETHNVMLAGIDQIEVMFRRLWADHVAVRHSDFQYVPAPAAGVIAVRFAVTNTLRDGTLIHKSNCNFFDVTGFRFTRVAVYMAGDNTLEAS